MGLMPMQIQRGIKPDRSEVVFDGITFEQMIMRFRALQKCGVNSRSVYIDNEQRFRVHLSSVYGDSENDNSTETLSCYEMIDVVEAGRTRRSIKDRWSLYITYWRTRSEDTPFDQMFPVPTRPTPANNYARKVSKPFVADRFYIDFRVPEETVIAEFRNLLKILELPS